MGGVRVKRTTLQSIQDKLDWLNDVAHPKWLGRKVMKVTEKLPEIPRDILRMLWKVYPYTLMLLVLPTSIVWTGFALFAVVAIIRPENLAKPSKFTTDFAQSYGFYMAIQAVGSALFLPQMFMVATGVHLVACAVCFAFSKRRKSEAAEEEEKVQEGKVEKIEKEKKADAEENAAALKTQLIPTETASAPSINLEEEFG